MTVACQASLSMEFSRQEYWSGLPFLSPGDFLNPGIEPGSPALQEDSLPTELELYQFSSVAQSCLTLCDHVDYSTPVFPVHHQLPELAHIHVYRDGDAIQPSHPLSSPSTFSLFQHQSLF